MNCQEIRELLPLYADGDLQGPHLEATTAHLEACQACQERLTLDRELAQALADLPAPAAAANMGQAVRARVMGKVRKDRRWAPLWRAAERLGNATAWVAVSAVTALLILALAITWRPIAERAWRARATPGTPSPGLGWRIVRDEVIAAPYYWAIDGERMDRAPQLSPDGTKVAYLPTIDGQATDLDRLVVRDLATGKDRDLTPEAGYSYTSVRWSPDSKSLAFVKYRYQENQPTPVEVWCIDADGSNLRRLYLRDGTAARGPAVAVRRWSADGRYVEIGPTIWGDTVALLRLRADGSGGLTEIVPVTSWFCNCDVDALVGETIYSPADDYALQVVQTGALLSKPESGQSLVLYDFSASRSIVLGSFPGVIGLNDGGISPDGEWIAFNTTPDGVKTWEGRVWLVRRDGSSLRQVTTPEGQAVLPMPGPLWAGGGRAYYNQPPYVSAILICEVDAHSGQAAPIHSEWPARELVSVSRDGRRLLAIRGEWDRAELHLLELAPAPAVEATATSAPAATAQPVEGPRFGPAIDLAELPPSVGMDYQISPDGRWVAYVALKEAGDDEPYPRQLLARNLETGETETLLENVPGEIDLSWFPDSRRLAIVIGAGGGQGGAVLLEGLGESAGRTLAVPEGDVQGFGEVAVSPDGGRVAFTVYHDVGPAPVPRVGIEVIDLDGSSRRQVVEPDFFTGRLAWTPDGARIVYFRGRGGTPPDDGESYVVDAGGAGEPRQVIARARLAGWSPDGRQALWLGEPADENGNADLWLAGLEPAPVTLVPLARGVSASGAAWAGSDSVVYAQQSALYLLPLSAGGQPRRLTPEGESAAAPVWLPGKGVAYASTREDAAAITIRLLPLQGVVIGEKVPVVETVAGLTVEEHAVADEATGFPRDVEGTGWLGAGILDTRRAWREPTAAERAAAISQALDPFGYRVQAKEKPGYGHPFFDLYRGGQTVLTDLSYVWPATLSEAGDDFALLVEQLRGPYLLVRRQGSEEWDLGAHAQQPPVYVGQDLLSVETDQEHQQLAVRRGQGIVYTFTNTAELPVDPVKGLWSWEGHWVLEANGRLVIDGQDVNQQLGYDEIFGWSLVRGKPFYFFSKDGRIGASYGGLVLPQQYEQVPHYQCCSGAAYNPGGNENMLWFFGLREGTWYYVEMGIYDPAMESPSETAVPSPGNPTPTPTPLTEVALSAFDMVDARVGWGVGDHAVLRTTDGGAEWRDVTPRELSASAALVTGAELLDADHAWVIAGGDRSDEPTLWHTANGGLTWQRSSLPVGGMGVDLSFVDSRRGWALVHQGAAAGSEAVAVLCTEDGGNSWATMYTTDPQSPAAGGLPFAGSKTGIGARDADTAWVSGFAPIDGDVWLYVTYDAGATWQEQSLLLPKGYEMAQGTAEPPVFYSAQDGVLPVRLHQDGTALVLYRTHDGGATWTAAPPVDAGSGGRVVYALAGPRDAWVLLVAPWGDGLAATLYRVGQSEDSGHFEERVFPNVSLADVRALDFAGDTGWGLGQGFLLRTMDGGKAWTRLPARLVTGYPAGATATYTDTEIGYAIDYPANWYIEATPGWSVILTSFDPAGPGHGGVGPDQAKIDLLPTKPYLDRGLDEMVAEVEAEAGQVLRKETWDLSGVPAVRMQIVAAEEGEGGGEKALLLTVIHGRSLWLNGYGDLAAFDPVARTLRAVP